MSHQLQGLTGQPFRGHAEQLGQGHVFQHLAEPAVHLGNRPLDRTAVEQNLLDNGVRSLVVSPLRYQDATIGTLVLTSPRPGDLNSLQAPRIQEVLPLFSMAVKRSALLTSVVTTRGASAKSGDARIIRSVVSRRSQTER